MKDILLLTPPFTQLNTPYPATAYLKGFLNTKGISNHQVDLGIEVIVAFFSKHGLSNAFETAANRGSIQSENAKRIFALRDDYIQSIDSIIEFLQGKNQTLARQICAGNYLPEAARFDEPQELDWAFGKMGMRDRATHLASLYLEDLSDFIVECVDENFGFSRYAERLGRSANSFDEIHENLQKALTIIDQITLAILEEKIKKFQPKLLCISVPFPGNLFSAFRCAQFIKKHYPHIKIVMGGGFPNTELRSLNDKRVFEYFDFITLDDGELPIELLHKSLSSSVDFKRTFLLENEKVVYKNNSTQADYRQSQIGTPDYSDLPLDQYISVIEMANPMHSLWSDGRWNKLTMAHGCYWAKCSFCDVSLDYVKLYEPVTANLVVDRMEEMILQTGGTGFHFVDEAAPPALMRAIAIEIIKRKLKLTWWANIRFEKSFTKDLCFLLKESGCIAVSGGLEVASDRLLKLIKKGVTVQQVAQVCNNLTSAGIMVHAYLMFGFPTQSKQETIDSLEMVRQLFESGVIESGFWHQFALTAHSPIGLNPQEFGIEPQQKEIQFANNDVEFIDKTGIKHERFSDGLKKALYNYMHDLGFDLPLQDWFDFKVSAPTIAPDFIRNCLELKQRDTFKSNAIVVWLGNTPSIKKQISTKKGKSKTQVILSFDTKTSQFDLIFSENIGNCLYQTLDNCQIHKRSNTLLSEVQKSFEMENEDFVSFWSSEQVLYLRDNGLLIL
ncbi:MAG: radical SAM protein [Flavobacteriales bacterium]|nr:radical SAM protein [Flavobacteriales bacterium]